MQSTSRSKRPSFGQWLKLKWCELLTIAMLGGIALMAFNLPPALKRDFAVFYPNGTPASPELFYPMRPMLIPTALSGALALLPPIAVFLLYFCINRDYWDLDTAIFGLIRSVLFAATAQSILKWLIGGFRPHFMEVCQPFVPLNGPQLGKGFQNLYYDRSVCTNADRRAVDEALQSFPSGHATAAFASGVYVTIWFFARLKTRPEAGQARQWHMAVVLLPILMATVISGTVLIDHYHHAQDVVGGAVIGTVMAGCAYKSLYCSILDGTNNDVQK